MIIKQKIMRGVSLTAHPKGCAQFTQEQFAWVKEAATGTFDKYTTGEAHTYPKRVLVIGGSTGYGLATRIVAGVLGKADTINVSFEREPSEKKTATPGWYNTMAFEQEAHKMGLRADSIQGDAFSHEIKAKTLDLIEKEYGQVDLVVYSLASPLRIDPDTGEAYRSVLRTTSETYSAKSIDPFKELILVAEVGPATEEQIAHTVKVMGGEDWTLWIKALKERDLLATGCKTVAYSYIGPEVTFPIYREGTIGQAKEHLEATAKELQELLKDIDGAAYVSVNKALVTRASSVIPVVPLYITILYRIMKEKDLHEGCIEQMYRLMTERLYQEDGVPVDEAGRIRLDDWEMQEDVQTQVQAAWDTIKQENLQQLADLAGFRNEYEKIHGFGCTDIDYSQECDPRVID